MAWVIEIVPPTLNRGLIGYGPWYLEGAIQDSISLTRDIEIARQFTNRVDANREIMIRQSWEPPYPELRSTFIITEVTKP